MLSDSSKLFSDNDFKGDSFSNISQKSVLIADSLKKILSIPSNYVGNKKRLLIHISDIVNENNLDFKRVIDPFSGSGVVSLFFNLIGYPTISNDVLSSSSMPILSLLKGKQVKIEENDLDHMFLNDLPPLTNFCVKNYNNIFFTEKECLFLDQYKSNIVRLVGNEFCVSEFKTLPIISSYEREKNHRTFEDNLKGTVFLFLLEKAITDICFVGGRYYNGQIMAKPEHRLAHDRNNNRDLIFMLRKKIKWMFKIYEKTFLFRESIVYNDDINYVLDQVFLDNNDDTLVYLDPPYAGNSSDYSNLYRFSEEFLYEDKIENLPHVMNGGKKFNNKKQYNEHFCEVLSKCYKAKYILTSFNASSFDSIENICKMIKKYKKNILIKSIPIAYNYRKDRTNFECVEKVIESNEEGIKVENSEREFLILAQ